MKINGSAGSCCQCRMRSSLAAVTRFAGEIKKEGFQDVVLLGMGGSSLAPEVIRSVIGRGDGYPNLHVLDSTDPAQILAIERSIDLKRSLFLVASKSGSTLEVNILKQYFFHRVVEHVGADEAGRRFVLTTDPGSKLHQVAQQERFRAVFDGVPSVGGRYSALSNFGLVPAALIGADLPALLDRAADMARRCASDGADNSAFELGVVLGELSLQGRDKPTLIAPPRFAEFWRVARAVGGRVTGEAGEGHHSDRRRNAGGSGGVRTRSRVRSSAFGCGGRRGSGDHRGPPQTRRASCHPNRLARSVRAWRGIFPLGVCDGCGRRGSQREPIRSTRCRSDQSRDATVGRGVREDRQAATRRNRIRGDRGG